ncbi:MAG TPA: thiamine ABC transporter substrate-binding protein [Eubacteriaceae bacterium]|nr:thiamine ABC transporter substrate-binding protein [Eubacteriaceae bacterium]
MGYEMSILEEKMLISIRNLYKSFGVDPILEAITFHLQPDAKVGVVGKNGSGKTTLFKILANQIGYEQGSIDRARDCTIGYLAQNSDLNPENTLFEELLTVFGDLLALEQEIRALEQEMALAREDELEKLLQQYEKRNELFEAKDGYRYESDIKGILIGLGFQEEDFSKKTKVFSSGQKTKIALAKLLLQKPNLLLLDEPTNFLDMDRIQWLESFLQNYEGAYMVISHDRYFLDRVSHQIFEIENKGLHAYKGNYTRYLEEKKLRQQAQQHQYEQQQKEIQRQQAVIDQLRQFNREKSIKRAQSREKALEKMERTDALYLDNNRIHMKFEPKIKSGKIVVEADHLKKTYDHLLFSDISFALHRQNKVGLIGLNGSGKTTLLNMIRGTVLPDEGSLKLGKNVEMAYFGQEKNDGDNNLTVIDHLWNSQPRESLQKIRDTLAYFGFYGEDVYKTIDALSGGEFARLRFAVIMLSDANFILLDEPTNHLDQETCTILEQAINDFTGTVFVVSHDRFFLNNVVDQLYVLKNQHLETYLGNYDYYRQKEEEQKQLEKLAQEANKPKETKTQQIQRKKQQTALNRERKKLKEEILGLEQEILDTEEEISSLEKEICKEGFYDDYERSCQINTSYEKSKHRLSTLMDQWAEKQSDYENFTQID